jgi:hypothetical protein
MSDFLGSAPARPRPQSDQARTLEMLATLFLVAFVVAMLYVGREIFIPIAIAILVSFVLSPRNLLLRRWGLGRLPSIGRRPCGAGHRIFDHRRFDPPSFRTGC